MPDADAVEKSGGLEFAVQKKPKPDFSVQGGPIPMQWPSVTVTEGGPAKLEWFRNAELFLVPPDNCGSAVGAPVDDDIVLVRADTLRSAVTSLETYAEDPTADLPRCPT